MYSVFAFIYYYVRPILKWFLRKTTGMCELMRICYGAETQGARVQQCEQSLTLSRTNHIFYMVQFFNGLCRDGKFHGDAKGRAVDEFVETILYVKEINRKIHYQFVRDMKQNIELIWGYRELITEVEALRCETYDSDNLQHEQRLDELWKHLMPNVRLESRISKQWQEIGFQGDDPKTDFRGMGMLGLENLLYFSTEFERAAQHVLSHSHHPIYGYDFAVVGINITSMAWHLLQDGGAKLYFYSTCKSNVCLTDFHRFYSYLFYEFDRFWIECKPKDIMEFSNIRMRFENAIKQSLQDAKNVFRINIAVDTV